MYLNFNFIYALLAIPAALAVDGQSCKTDYEGFGGYGICTPTMSCMPVKCAGRKRCINENYSVIPFDPCPDDSDSVCCIKIVKKLNGETLPTPGRCLNKANCDSKKNKIVETKECPGKDAVLCIPENPNDTNDTKTDDTKTDNTKTDNTKTDNTKTDNTKTDNTKTNDGKTSNTETNSAETNNSGTNNVGNNNTGTNNETNDTKTNNTETNNAETTIIKSFILSSLIILIIFYYDIC